MVTDGDGVEPEAFALLSDLDGVLTKLADCDLTGLSGPQLLEFTRAWEAFTRRSVTVTHAAVSELDGRHAGADTGHHSTAALLCDLVRIDPGQARRRVRDAGEFGPRRGLSGEPLPPLLPQAAQALEQGRIGIGHARAISDLFRDLSHVPLDTATEQSVESNAVDVATICSPHRLAQWCAQIQNLLDQDGKEPSCEAKKRHRDVSLVDLPDGWAKLTGRLDPYAAAALRAVLGPLSAPAPAQDGARDERTPSQRRHDGLADACTRLLRSGDLPDSGGAATTILVTINYHDLLARYQAYERATAHNSGASGAGTSDGTEAGSADHTSAAATSDQSHTDSGYDAGSQAATATGHVGEGRAGPDGRAGCGPGGPGHGPGSSPGSGYGVTSYGTLIPVEELLRRASDAKIIPVVLNDTGGVMAYGRGRRLATAAQRRALAARDGGCVRPGCTVPADWTEVHHTQPWRHGGTTDINTQALVCPHDHDALERGASIVMISGGTPANEGVAGGGGVPHWVEPAYLDPGQTPRRNTAHHIRRLFVPPPTPEPTPGQDP